MAGRPLVAWSLAAMRAAEAVTVVVVAAPPGHEEELERLAERPRACPASRARFTRSSSPAATPARTRSPTRWPRSRRGRRSSPSTTPPARWSRRSWSTRWSSGWPREPEAAGVIAAAPVADTVKRVGDARRRSIATESRERPLGGADPAGVPGRGAAAAHDATAARSRPRPTTRCWSRRPAAGCWSNRRRRPNLKVTTAADLATIEALLGGLAPQHRPEQGDHEGELAEGERGAEVGGAEQPPRARSRRRRCRGSRPGP